MHDKHSTKPRQTSLLHHSSPGSPLAAESLVISVLKEELLDSFDEVFLDTQNPPGFLGAWRITMQNNGVDNHSLPAKDFLY